MAGSGKRKTTMAKLTRESKLREKRMVKQAKKNARKLEAANPSEPPSDDLHEDLTEDLTESAATVAEPPLGAVAETLSDA